MTNQRLGIQTEKCGNYVTHITDNPSEQNVGDVICSPLFTHNIPQPQVHGTSLLTSASRDLLDEGLHTGIADLSGRLL